MIKIYTDGCCLGNPGKGGYGVVIKIGNEEQRISGGFLHTTNNRMELMAVIVALETIKEPKQRIHIISDSQYVLNYIRDRPFANFSTKKWANLKNPDLWKRYIKCSEGHKISTEWVRGHTGHLENEICDTLAKIGANEAAEPDNGYLALIEPLNELF